MKTKLYIVGIVLIKTLLGACKSLKDPRTVYSDFPLSKQKFENSISQTLDEFFQRRMANEEFNKVAGRKCEILADDSSFVYFGYPYNIDSIKKVDTLFKTSIDSLMEIFPSYKNIEGYHIFNKINDTLQHYITRPVNYTMLSTNAITKFNLTSEIILVNIQIELVRDFILKDKYFFTIALNKSNLEIVSISRQSKLKARSRR